MKYLLVASMTLVSACAYVPRLNDCMEFSPQYYQSRYVSCKGEATPKQDCVHWIDDKTGLDHWSCNPDKIRAKGSR